jgi:hypothetical protein
LNRGESKADIEKEAKQNGMYHVFLRVFQCQAVAFKELGHRLDLEPMSGEQNRFTAGHNPSRMA